MMIFNVVVLVGAGIVLALRKYWTPRIVFTLMLLFMSWNIMDAGVGCAMRNLVKHSRMDGTKSKEYLDGWMDGARATQDAANKFRDPVLIIALAFSALSLIPKKGNASKAEPAAGQDSPEAREDGNTTNGGRKTKR